MKTRITSKVIAIVTAVLMVFVMMPQFGAGKAFAEDINAPGGVVASNSASDANAAFEFGGADNVDASYADHTLTITVKGNIYLAAPVVFKQGSAEDKVVLDLNGHTLKGSAGTALGTREAATGKDAIQIIPGQYNIEITDRSTYGGGVVVGGKGAVYETNVHLRSGADGGNAITFTAGEGSVYQPTANNGKLEYGLEITGGAAITGGAGADMAGDDWIYNIDKYSGEDEHSHTTVCPQFKLKAGSGGTGIGQIDTSQSYSKVEIKSGTVTGGVGGNLDMGTNGTPLLTHYNLMNNSAIDSYMQELSDTTDTYDDYVSGNTKFVPGAGGDGIIIGAGRKYVYVEQGQVVSGGACGAMDYGKNKLVNRISNEKATAGSGIYLCGDIGLKSGDVDADTFTQTWSSRDKDSDDMGIYIAGTVKGGDSPDADAMNENTGDGGDGIMVNYYQDKQKASTDPTQNWGIVEVGDTGKVLGGNAGTAVCGTAGTGGAGIDEIYTKSADQATGDSVAGTDYYIVNGTVKGGTGGDSFGTLKGSGNGGNGGIGITTSNYREDAVIVGNGLAKGGDGGKAVVRNGETLSDTQIEGIRFYPPNYSDWNNTVALRSEEGGAKQPITVNNSGVSVTTTMSAFADYPSTSTELECKVKTPAGYSGDVYVRWTSELKLQSNTPDACDIEPPATNITNFNLLSDEQYKYLMYPDGYLNGYNLNIATTGRIEDTIRFNNSTCKIWCNVQLDDGRWAVSEPMTFTKDGWSGGGSEPQVDPAEQEAAVRNVMAMIDALYESDSSEISRHDEPAITAAREAYDELVDEDNPFLYLIDETILQKLTAAEDRLDWFEAIDNAVEQTVGLLEVLGNTQGVSDEDFADAIEYAQGEIEDVRDLYDALDEEQLTLISSYEEMLEAAEALVAIDNNTDYQTALEEYLSDYGFVNIEETDVSVENAKYTGMMQFPKVTITYGGKTLTEDVDFTAQYEDNIDVGWGTVTIKGMGRFTGEGQCDFEITKGDNTLDVVGKTGTVKYKKLKKKSQYLTIGKVVTFNDPGQGTRTYKKLKGNKKITINKTTGKVTVKKKLKKKTYSVRVQITAAGDENHEAVSKTVTFKVKVKK